MNPDTRKHYIDNLRWIILLILIPYHTAMAWNVWGEPNYIYFEGNRLISSIVVFFTKYTDLTGADGGFSLGQFWFLLYLLIISVVGLGIITLLKNNICESEKSIPFWHICVLGLPLPLLSELLSIGGKSLAEYTYLFMIGYFVFADDRVISKADKNSWLLLGIGLAATILNVYLFIWADKQYILLNTITQYVSEWAMIIALIGLAKRYLNFNVKVSNYMKTRSFLFYIYHFIWVVLFQYLLYGICGNHTFVLYVGTVLLSYFITFVCCEISIRIPFLCFVTGTKYSPAKSLTVKE